VDQETKSLDAIHLKMREKTIPCSCQAIAPGISESESSGSIQSPAQPLWVESRARDRSRSQHLYSLRHTAIDTPIIKSDGQVNVFTPARNAATSVDQIERFYASRREMARNLQLDMTKIEKEREGFRAWSKNLTEKFTEQQKTLQR